MSDGGLHINTTFAGDITVPLTTLINRVCDGAGAVYSPVRRIADAWADSRAKRMEAKTKHAVAELAQEERYRKEQRATIHQKNIAAILSEAVPRITNPKANEISEDWILNFSEKARLISDDLMQKAWARLLAEEANKPGSFSKRTVNLLNDMERRDAEAFQTLCQFIIHFDGGHPYALIIDEKAPIYVENGLTFSILTHLESFGLIRFDSLRGHRVGAETWPILFHYHNRSALIYLIEGYVACSTGSVLLTRAGQELCSLGDKGEPIDGFFEYLCRALSNGECTVTEFSDS